MGRNLKKGTPEWEAARQYNSRKRHQRAIDNNNPELIAAVEKADVLDASARINGLTHQQLNTCDEFLKNGGNMTAAVKKFYNVTTNISAANTGSKLKNTPLARAYISRRLHEGKMLDKAVDVHLDALDAWVIREGVETAIPDHKTRMTAAREIFKMCGAYPEKRTPQQAAEDDVDMETIRAIAVNEHPEVINWMLANDGRVPTIKMRKQIIEHFEKKRALGEGSKDKE